MPLRLLPWAPEYGTSVVSDSDDSADSRTEVDAGVEQARWAAVEPQAEAPAALQIVDGVRRAEAHTLDDGPAGEPLFGLFGSFAVGVVRCGEGGARIPEPHLRVERRYLQAGGDPVDREVSVGDATLSFRAVVPAGASSGNALIDALNRTMLDEEAKLAEELSRDQSTLTFVDGPLRLLRSPGPRVVGYVKRIHNWYLDSERLALLPALAVGQRTPIVRLTSADGHERLSWFLRLADLGGRYHTLGGLLRLEAPGGLPLREATLLADQSSLVLPRLASSPARDPRAPQNLTPVGALEQVLTHRLGDRRWLRRLIAASVGEGADAVAAAAALVRGSDRMTARTATGNGNGSAIASESARVGLVLGTEDAAATPLGFWVYVDPRRYLQLDDVVHVHSPLPDGRAVDLYGVVDEVRAHHEGVSFTSDVALANDGVLPVQGVVSAHVAVTRVEPEIYVPPMPGQPVALAEDERLRIALFYDRMAETFPLGLARTGERVLGDLGFLDGTDGAHVNISGISGVATKTSYATFLLHALFEGEALRERAANAKALIFNVKGEDLLFLDRPNTRLDEAERARYERLGLPARPFGSVGFFAPVRRGDQPLPETGSRQEGVTGFFWTLREFCERRYLRFLFADAESEFSQLSYVVDAVEAQLRMAARQTPPDAAGVEVDGVTVSTFDELADAIELHTDPDANSGGHWAGSGNSTASVGTIRAFMRRLRAASRHVGHLVRGEEFAFANAVDHRVDLSRQQVTVVDIHNLHDRAQRFVVGVLLSEQIEERESRQAVERPPPLFVVVDELNKYAPRDGRSPIKELLLDIAERGRSLGVILIGAQQTASEVEPRIVANCAFRVVGRLDAAEAQRGEYRFLSSAARERARLLKPGTMIVQQPQIPVPLLVEFPRPAWATRPAEAAATAGEADAFARFER